MKNPVSWWLILALLLVVAVLGIIIPSGLEEQDYTNISAGDTAWMLTATALVLLMTPGLAFFYGGMVGKKNVISTVLQSFIAMVIVTVLWVVVGFGMCFGPSIGGVIGDPSYNMFFQGVSASTAWDLAPTIPLPSIRGFM